MSVYVILHNIRSAHNVGSVFRTSDGAGVAKIFLSGYTPAPIDRFGRVRKEIEKTSLGASRTVPYELVPDIRACITSLEKQGITVVAVEQTDSAIAYDEYLVRDNIAYIFGNETEGIEKEVLEMVNDHVHIPMQGSKESLNVSVCAGVILFSHTKKLEGK